MNKNLTILSIIVILILLGGFAYWQMSSTVEEDNLVNTNQSKEQVDISDWVTYRNEELGISYKHPSHCTYASAGPSTAATIALGCDGPLMNYRPLGYSYTYRENFKDFYSRDIKELAEIYYFLNKENDNSNIPSNRFIGDLERKDINNYEAYQFILDWEFVEPNPEDYSKIGSGVVLDEVNRIIFMGNQNKKILIKIKYNDPISETILNTFEFID